MHTLYRWEFDKIKKNLLTPLNAMSEEEMMPAKTIKLSDIEEMASELSWEEDAYKGLIEGAKWAFKKMGVEVVQEK